MPKSKKITRSAVDKADFEEKVMAKIRSGQVKMKPKWLFITGSVLSLAGLVGLSVSAVFLINIVFFLLRKHGPMGNWRLELMLNSLPFWVPVAAIICLVGGIWLLKKYDFSYKKNFALIILGFIFSIIIAAWVVDAIGFNERLLKKGRMRRFYQQLEKQEETLPRGRGNGLYRKNIQK